MIEFLMLFAPELIGIEFSHFIVTPLAKKGKHNYEIKECILKPLSKFIPTILEAFESVM